MNKTTEALKLAEEALESCNSGKWSMSFDEIDVERALAAIREALADHPMDYDQGFVDGVEAQLAEPVKQEPVAYIRKDQLQRAMKYPCLCEISPEPRSDRVEIYAAPVSAEAAVLAEREACAKVCEEEAKAYQIQGMLVADECAAAIRARGEK